MFYKNEWERKPTNETKVTIKFQLIGILDQKNKIDSLFSRIC